MVEESERTEVSAMVTRYRPSKNQPKSTNAVDKSTYKCTHCNQNGHTKNRCYELVGYPEWWDHNRDPRKRNSKRTSSTAVVETKTEDDVTGQHSALAAAAESQGPVGYDNGVTYMFIQHNNVYLMTASRQNCNAASLILFLHHVVDVFRCYFEELEEESIRDNFVVVYELLDEMMDFGYPQYTDAKIISEFIKTDAYRMEVTQRPPMALTNAVSWRSEGIFYSSNEFFPYVPYLKHVFLDVVESVNILVNSNGQIIRSDVIGAIKMRTYLRKIHLNQSEYFPNTLSFYMVSEPIPII
ncbi:hypothetical protein RJ640_030206 [Escallonia rubra]|uniref:MHD domain-containing protein n=1 Tax=Escallonia rubra TaxID=112253 RepID=A0AA88UQL2_9ASTE|nr:hypothetical protein RJ640_030206 [Escallonia rubra]